MIPEKENLDRLLSYKPGGIHRFTGIPPEILRQHAEYLQENSSIPMLLSADIEFSESGSFQSGTVLPNQLGVAATGDPEAAKHMGAIAGREGKYCGFNWSFSPVIDINYNFNSPIVNTRSFGSDPDTILAMAREYILSMQSEGMAACVKHWPGDGMDDRDQHLVTTRNSMEMNNWRNTYGRLYKTMIDSGVKTIMSAHITLPAYYREKYTDVTPDKILPGTISRELNIDLLRGELGFNGLIISDATGMAGLTSQGLREKIVPMVIENGCDMFLFSVDDDMDFSLLIKGVESGSLSRERLDDAVTRVLALKASLGLHRNNFLPDESDKEIFLRTKEHSELEKKIAEKSITLVKDTQHLLPLSLEKHLRILLIQQERKGSFGPVPPFIVKKHSGRKRFQYY